jgi:XTP/dITP diphosphohydrolase
VSIELLFATTNLGKVREVRQILEPFDITVRSLRSLALEVDEPQEDADTFAGNALIKARVYAAATSQRCLAEDSGLVVDALDGAPGVYSARYSGMQGDRQLVDEANNRKLLEELAGVPAERRTARFVCAMCVCEPDGSVLATAEGRFEGRIAESPAGSAGFGYDPIFWVEECRCTSAELHAEQKNALSHRGAAARRLGELLLAARR